MTLLAVADANLSSKKKKDLADLTSLAVCKISSKEFRKGVSHTWRGRGNVLNGTKPTAHGELISNRLGFWICSRNALDRDGYPLYVELTIGPDNKVGDKAQHLAFFSESLALAKNDRILADFVGRCLRRKLQNVYIPADFAHPRGCFVAELDQNIQRLKALLISFFGIRNPRMCRHCITAYTSTTNWNDEHILWPFHCCISIKSFLGGQCSNCAWSTKTDCEWRFLSPYQADDDGVAPMSFPLLGGEAVGESPSSYTVDRLNPASCPRITNHWPAEAYGKPGADVWKKIQAAIAKDKKDDFHPIPT